MKKQGKLILKERGVAFRFANKNKARMAFILLIGAFLLPASIRSQSYVVQKNHSMNHLLWGILDSLSVTYNPPLEFVSNNDSEGFATVPHLYKLHGWMYYLESKDRNFLICLNAEFCHNDSVKTRERVEINLKGELCTSLYPDTDYSLYNDEPKIKIKHHVTYSSPEYAKTTFNADTVIRYKLKMYGWKLQERYTDNTVFMLQKSGRGFVSLFCFYTEEGKKNFDHYMKMIENMIWFREYVQGEPLDDIKVIPFSKLYPPRIIN
ncbi:hypothetical protein [Parabacteroides pacaensis]|uniref:hypothetical protein n=1 Tax=Parabacteroides pacaensis TaxID=2086575 RepID=UPI000D0EEE0C|nr:hypothetical protein [Parabacteroides pacaensis]